MLLQSHSLPFHSASSQICTIWLLLKSEKPKLLQAFLPLAALCPAGENFDHTLMWFSKTTLIYGMDQTSPLVLLLDPCLQSQWPPWCLSPPPSLDLWILSLFIFSYCLTGSSRSRCSWISTSLHSSMNQRIMLAS